MEHFSIKGDDFRYEIEFANDLTEMDVYRLLTILFSSKAIHNANPPIFGLPMAAWRFERAEIYRIVFNLAIKGRNMLDFSNEDSKKISETPTGQLEQSLIVNELSFREACNKIIHSEHINFGLVDYEGPDDHKGVTEFIYVYGRKGNNEWKATINLIPFSDVMFKILNNYFG